MGFCKNCDNEFELPFCIGGANHYDLVDYYCEVCGRYLDTIEIGGTVLIEGYGWTLDKKEANERKNSH